MGKSRGPEHDYHVDQPLCLDRGEGIVTLDHRARFCRNCPKSAVPRTQVSDPRATLGHLEAQSGREW